MCPLPAYAVGWSAIDYDIASLLDMQDFDTFSACCSPLAPHAPEQDEARFDRSALQNAGSACGERALRLA